MAAFNKDPVSEAQQLRQQGYTDDLIGQELTRRGYTPEDVGLALSQLDTNNTNPMDAQQQPPSYPNPSQNYPQQSNSSLSANAGDNALYERLEEIAESLIDEKWDELLAEVKKIVEWKERMEEKQTQLQSDIEKLKEDFKVLHQGVLGKLDDYDTRMRDVGTELKAVGKVFKDVIPEFVENVKELSATTKMMKKDKKSNGS